MDKLSRILQETYDRERAEEELRRATKPEWTTPQMTVLKEIGGHLLTISRLGLAAVVLLSGLIVLLTLLALAG